MFSIRLFALLGGRRMSLSLWDEGSDSDHVTGLWDNRLVGHRKILAWQWAKLPRDWREGAVEVRPFTAKKRLFVSEAQGLSGEAMKRNPTTTVIPGVDESKPRSSSNRRLDRTFSHNVRRGSIAGEPNELFWDSLVVRCLFELDQGVFSHDTPAISAQTAVFANYSMTRNYECNGVGRASSCYSS